MKKEIKVGLFALFLGILIPGVMLGYFGPPGWPNNHSLNLSALVFVFCIGILRETKTLKQLITQFGQMFYIGFFLFSIPWSIVTSAEDHIFYWAASGQVLSLLLTIGGTWAIAKSKRKRKVSSTT